MFSLKSRQDAFRLLLPNEFICDEINEKYQRILIAKNSFYTTPIDFVNETIQKVDVLGFNNATIQQQQSYNGHPVIDKSRIKENEFMYPSGEYTYRNAVSPLSLIDKTIRITFRHTLGFLNYFMLFENFIYQYTRDRYYKDITYQFNIDLFNERGSIYARIVLDSPFIHSMDMLSFDYTQPVAQSQTFNMEFNYSNVDFQFIEVEDHDAYYEDPDVIDAKTNNFYNKDSENNS